MLSKTNSKVIKVIFVSAFLSLGEYSPAMMPYRFERSSSYFKYFEEIMLENSNKCMNDK